MIGTYFIGLEGGVQILFTMISFWAFYGNRKKSGNNIFNFKYAIYFIIPAAKSICNILAWHYGLMIFATTAMA